MSLKKKTLISYVTPLVAIVVLLGLLIVALFRLSTIQKEMRYNTNANMVWVVYYAQLESFRLMDTIQKQALDIATAESVEFRYQMLLSRLHLLQDGPQARFFEKTQLQQQLTALNAQIRALAPQLEQAVYEKSVLLQVQMVLDDFNRLMLTASNEAMTTQWDELGESLAMHRSAVLTIIFIMVGILLCSLFVSVLLLMALRQARESERVKQREIELKKQLEHERKVTEIYKSFGSMVSHQFRTPLAIIDASMQRMVRKAHRLSPEELIQRATKVRHATGRLTQLIERILHADRFMEQVNVRIGRHDLISLVRTLVEDPSSLKSGRHIQFNCDLDKAWVHCDPVLTGQILLNFLSNADKYSEPNALITVSVYRQADSVCCSVRDQGRGIAKKDLPHVFQRYFRSDAVSDVMGTGIGLYIVSELAVLQNAQVSAESIEGEYSLFSISFPCLAH